MMTYANSADRIPINLTNTPLDGMVKTSVPLAKGLLYDIHQSQLVANGQVIDCGAKVLATWPDKSVKWLHLSFTAPSSDDGESDDDELTLTLEKKADANLISRLSGFHYESNNSQTTVSNSHYTFTLNHENGQFSITPSANENCDANPITGELTLLDASEQECAISSCSVSSITTPNLLDASIFTLSLQVMVNYKTAVNDSKSGISSRFEFHFDSAQSDIQLDITLHNSKAAVHTGGSWDLGDPNSFQFSEFSLSLHSSEDLQGTSSLSYQLDRNAHWQTPQELPTSIFQHSSGGKNWQSPVHLDHQQKIPFDVKGYIVEQQGKQIFSGERAAPQISWVNGLNLAVADFWQKFPSAITIYPQTICLGLFPKQDNKQYELQGGEKSTHSICFGVKNAPNGAYFFTDGNYAKPHISQYAHTDIPLYTEFQQVNGELQSLINNGLHSQRNFFEKREMLDEYGWRNFGDIYADHETAEHQDDSIFVSHYNNQYDPIYGFLRQFILSNDQQWFTLADDLAKHVMDIDIYHTKDDKDEYNGGLFWHTDHYLQAFTSSHRSYSKHQGKGAYQDHAGGGGPGGQHCYTSGLTLYYLLTGNQRAKEAVLTLTNWITYVYEGGNTCFELLLALKNRHVPGLKNHFNGQYPLDRGTANYINALLDSYVLTTDDTLLRRVEHIIQHTVHPNEDITLRNLENIEETWFYTVFLQSVVRYLDIKRANNELNQEFYYARDCLMHFAHWMHNHEYMYLDKPDILEYPNDTWTAQDLRKAHVLSAAYYYANKTDNALLEKAKYFEHEVATRLALSDTKTYTRIMVLLMQNDGPTHYYENLPLEQTFATVNPNWAKPKGESNSVIGQVFTAFCKRLLALSISNEVNWLKKRLG